MAAGGRVGALAARLASALIAIPLALYAMLAWPRVFEGVVTLFALIGVREFFRLAEMRGTRPLMTLGLIVTGAMCLAAHTGQERYVYYVLTAGVMLSGTMLMTRNKPNGTLNYAVTVLGITYVGWFLAHVILLLRLPAAPEFAVHYTGTGYLIFLLLVLMLGDSGAYFAGRALGRHRLMPGISPNKTVEGAIGGFLFSLLGGLLCKQLQLLLAHDRFQIGLFPDYATWEYLYLAGIVAILGQVGDLVESFLKRDIGVKDSGVFLPGHGGFLDRFDSLLYAVPVMYYYAKYVH